MLEFYLKSIIIWAIINYSIITMLGPKIKENGWTESNGTIIGKWKAILIGSTIPVIRFLVFLCFIGMSKYTKQQYDKEYEKIKKWTEE